MELLLTKPVEPLINVQIRHLGGALAEPGVGAGASGAVAEPYLLGLLGLGLPHAADATRAKQAEAVADLEAYISGRKPYTLLSPGDTAAKSFSSSALARLREIKRARDPHNVFRELPGARIDRFPAGHGPSAPPGRRGPHRTRVTDVAASTVKGTPTQEGLAQ
ncbi:hypothetical protein [Nonomuraea turkmeniaca]|uniref:hypothetical protein n=1 Tax=Nonomuraea turkmeniaca TaxID=103838 RepID=UPI001B87975B|nr:hypothetical protein [Nonomuraea turkmeniaca]